MDQKTIDLLIEENARIKKDFLRVSERMAAIEKAAHYAHDAIVLSLSNHDERLPKALLELRKAGIGEAESKVCAFCGKPVTESFGSESDYQYVCESQECEMFKKSYSDDMKLPPWCL